MDSTWSAGGVVGGLKGGVVGMRNLAGGSIIQVSTFPQRSVLYGPSPASPFARANHQGRGLIYQGHEAGQVFD